MFILYIFFINLDKKFVFFSVLLFCATKIILSYKKMWKIFNENIVTAKL